MKFKARTISQLADMICGNFDQSESVFIYRSSSFLTRFFQDADTDYEHDGSTRALWVQSVLEEILENEPRLDASTPPDAFLRVIVTLMDQGDALNEDHHRPKALEMLNGALAKEGFEAFYAENSKCYLRRTDGNRSVPLQVLPHRPFSKVEQERRNLLEAFLQVCSEDQLIEHVLLPLLRQLGFQRISVAGHKDKALEYGKDLWMRYSLPTQHVLYFGIQAKKGKLDASGRSTENIAEILNQTTMMLGHEIFDPEVSRRVLVDHAYIVAGGEITKSARNWLGQRLDATKRSQIMFMDRDDILNLFVAANVALPKDAQPLSDGFADEIPF
ncbi:hypothetical protein [Paracoccus marcusii]|uniref:hypothetical protein n=1 Tax=Paracoccus marcusii TaxID=59779 RepID=UPI003265C9B5